MERCYQTSPITGQYELVISPRAYINTLRNNMRTYNTMGDFLSTSPDVTKNHDEAVRIMDLETIIEYSKTTKTWLLLSYRDIDNILKNSKDTIDVKYIPNFLNSYTVSTVLHNHLSTIRDRIANIDL